ncbi:MAG: ABC transporter substrate-binding protein [Gemmatimonadaceae bacterium]
MRVISLIPGATEIVAALGAEDSLVAVSHECDYPPRVTTLPRATRSAMDAMLPPGEVDHLVRESTERGDALYDLDESLIESLEPDVIFTQGVCDVCAVRERDVRSLAQRLSRLPKVVSLDSTTLDGVLTDIATVGQTLGMDQEATQLVASLTARMRRVHEHLGEAGAPRPRVVVIEWSDPPYTAGHWVPQMVRCAGGREMLAEEGERSRAVPVAELAAAEPEVVVLAPCGYDVHRAAGEGHRLMRNDGWRWLAGARTWAVDANALFSRPGPRLVAGIETLAAILHPSLFPAPLADRAIELGAP